MNIVMFAGDFYPNISGGAHARWKFAKIAAKEGHNITVFTPIRGDGAKKREFINGVEIHRPFKMKPDNLPPYASLSIIFRIIFSIALLFYAAFILRNRKIDGIHSTSYTTHWVAKILSVLHKCPLITFIGYTASLQPKNEQSVDKILEWVNIKFFMGEVVFCRAPKTKQIVKNITSADVRILHGVLNESKVRKAYEKSKQKNDSSTKTIELIFVGRLSNLKNPEAAVNIISDLPDKYSLNIIGSGPKKPDIENQIGDSNLHDRIHLMGELTHEETLEEISSADGLILTSKAEAYPTVVFEGLALTDNVFATPVGILPHLNEERLHLAETNQMPAAIKGAEKPNDNILHEEILKKYSMNEYAEGILKAFRNRV